MIGVPPRQDNMRWTGRAAGRTRHGRAVEAGTLSGSQGQREGAGQYPVEHDVTHQSESDILVCAMSGSG